MPLYQPVAPPPKRPPQNGLLQAARLLGMLVDGTMSAVEGPAPTEPPEGQQQTTDREAWHRVGGVSFLADPCTGGGTFDPCDPSAEPLVAADTFPAGTESAGFPVKAGVECVTTDRYTRDESAAIATRYLDWRQHYLIGREFWRGEQATAAGWPNFYLADSSQTTTIGVGLSPCGALGLLEEAAAGVATDTEGSTYFCGGSQAIIHASPALANAWARDFTVERVGNPNQGMYLITPQGTIVITGPGYDGTGPGYDGPEDVGEGETWAYLTGWLQVRLSPTEVYTRESSVNKDTNSYEQWAVRAANVAADSCCALAVQAVLGDCSVESGTGQPAAA